METENQRAGHGRSRGKWNRQKRKENEEKNRQSGLNENTQNQAAHRIRKTRDRNAKEPAEKLP